MKEKINTYFAVLLITIAGAGAALLIIHIATAETTIVTTSSEADDTALKESILRQ